MSIHDKICSVIKANRYKLVNDFADKIYPGFEGSPSDASYTFLRRYFSNEVKQPFTEKEYNDDKLIISTLNGYDIDIEQFWYAVLFIYDITMDTCHDITKFGKPTKTQAQELRNFINARYNIVISDGKEKVKINDSHIIMTIRNAVDSIIADPEIFDESRFINPFNAPSESYSNTIKAGHAATLFSQLFNFMELPTIRRERMGTKKSINLHDRHTDSYSKDLLISRLIYMMKLVDNEAFLYSEDSLKGIIKEYKKRQPHSFGRFYC